VDARIANLTIEQIVARLANAPPIPLDGPYPEGLLKERLRPAAVLIPLMMKEKSWHVLLIRRAEHSEDLHSGQVAFPGGGAHPEDLDIISTALRESHEELGILPGDVRVLGKMNEFITISSYKVTPVVGVIPYPYEFQLDKREVTRVFSIPLEWLADPTHYEIRQRELPPPYPPIEVIYYHPYDGENLWGASARFMLGLIHILNN
jgi:8-oxo-dGTP pyrophosphatase MutT (NUDIX family)